MKSIMYQNSDKKMKGYNLILEGCDGVGKTTVFNILLKRGKFLIGLHTDAPRDKDSYRIQLTNEINSLNKSVGILYDRFSLSECVYAPMLRGYYPGYMRELETTIKPHTFLVLLTAPASVIKERYDGKVLKKEQISECLNRYEKEFRKSKIKHKFIINSGIHKPDEIIKEIFEHVKRAGYEHSYYVEDFLNQKR